MEGLAEQKEKEGSEDWYCFQTVKSLTEPWVRRRKWEARVNDDCDHLVVIYALWMNWYPGFF